MRKHLTVEQRYAIDAMLQRGVSQKAMAAAIGVDKALSAGSFGVIAACVGTCM